MKMFNKIFIVLLVLITTITSCRKTEVDMEELYVNVKYQNLITEDAFNLKLKSSVKPKVLGDNYIINSISQVNIKATNISSNYSVYDEFTVDENGEDELILKGVQLGTTLSEINTLSKQIYGPNDTDEDGIDYGPFETTSEEFVNEILRPLYPYVTFNGNVTHNVQADQNNNYVSCNMNPNQGRLIITIKMEQEAKRFGYGKGILLFNNEYTSGKNWFNKVVDNNAYFYLSNEKCTNKTNLNLDIYFFDWDEKLINKWSLKSEELDKLKIENGKDKWVDITLTADAITSSIHYGYDFEFPWEEINKEISLE